ncbi:HAD family hydrolase [Mucilaginibacter sp. BT774]|uniref:HAD family hydrolase n=1 Tax=Mucilaginibacter sp. BT774 TaxID=3062276 RepID=UPI0026754E8A|nr:HAD family hydrolase [Mucilaginibacter sp. BT774]MDO3626249.1 HAD family hydrolase [Mucilaginibacter sp. BT774]
MKKALILDLDNTIYPVSSIAENLFADLFAKLDQYAEFINADDADEVNKIKDEMTRRPFQHIAEEFNLNKEVRNQMIGQLRNMTYDLPMQPFDDYGYVRSIQLDKFLVTTGFSKLQWSKVRMLGIENDFKHIYIVDPEVSSQTKKDVFTEIMQTYNYIPGDLLVIGDDPESEIKAAQALDIETVLYDPWNKYPTKKPTYRIDSLRAIQNILS